MFTDTSKKVFDKDLIEIELLLNLKLPLDLRNHYLEYNGGIPSNEYYYMDEYDTFLWIDSFIPFKYENKKLKNGTIEKIYSHLVQKNALPENFIPFSSDLGGNKICLDVKNWSYLYCLYGLRKSYEKPWCEKENVCVEKVIIYLNGYKKSALSIYFEDDEKTTWKVDESQGLLTKHTIIDNDVTIESINLNKPSIIEKLIRYHIRKTWKPKETSALEIYNAILLIEKYGFNIEVNRMGVN